MTTPAHLDVDVAIFGGGVAGLWLLNRLRKLGFNAVLLEANALGAGQTLYAQGIIHGGIKYALTGKLSDSSKAVAHMPGLWRECLQGNGEIDLSGVKILSPYQYLWSTKSLTSKVAGFFASKVMTSRTTEVSGSERPQVFQNTEFHGQVYRLQESIIDTASLVRTLVEPHKEAIFKLNWDQTKFIVQDKERIGFSVDRHDEHVIDAKALVLTAGKGNAEILSRLGRQAPPMQLRPLRQVIMRGNLPDMLYAHCLGASVNPRITITGHRDAHGAIVWYLGGQLAEDGVNRSIAGQIEHAKTEVAELLPWLDLRGIEWATLDIDRAEAKQAGGKRPEGVFVDYQDGVITGWPTKMVLAPKLADDIVTLLNKHKVSPSGASPLPNWPHPDYAVLPWQQESKWRT
jgi:glycine/D-amino acid oxidase-like deaminating enzyme